MLPIETQSLINQTFATFEKFNKPFLQELSKLDSKQKLKGQIQMMELYLYAFKYMFISRVEETYNPDVKAQNLVHLRNRLEQILLRKKLNQVSMFNKWRQELQQLQECMRNNQLFKQKSYQSPIIVKFANQTIGKDIFTDMKLTLETTANIYEQYLDKRARWLYKFGVSGEPLIATAICGFKASMQIRNFTNKVNIFETDPLKLKLEDNKLYFYLKSHDLAQRYGQILKSTKSEVGSAREFQKFLKWEESRTSII